MEGSNTGNAESYVRNAGKALEMVQLSRYSGSVRRTWKEGSYTEDCEGQVTADSGNGSFLGGSIRGTLGTWQGSARPIR
jgi:hypothetical protein